MIALQPETPGRLQRCAWRALLAALALSSAATGASAQIGVELPRPRAQARESETSAGTVRLKVPGLLPFPDMRAFALIDDYEYRIKGYPHALVIPRGFVTDLASIPRPAQSFVSVLDRHGLPAILHDYLYWEQGCSRRQADDIFDRAMDEMGLGVVRRVFIYRAVRSAGSGAWRSNRLDRVRGMPRVVPPTAIDERKLGESWEAYRVDLHDAGVRPPRSRAPMPRGFCSLRR